MTTNYKNLFAKYSNLPSEEKLAILRASSIDQVQIMIDSSLLVLDFLDDKEDKLTQSEIRDIVINLSIVSKNLKNIIDVCTLNNWPHSDES